MLILSFHLQNEVDVNEVTQIVKAADGKVGIFHFGNQSRFRLTIEQLQMLGQLKFRMNVRQVFYLIVPLNDNFLDVYCAPHSQ